MEKYVRHGSAVGWFGGWLVRLAGWLVGWLVGWLAGWLVGWLAGCFGGDPCFDLRPLVAVLKGFESAEKCQKDPRGAKTVPKGSQVEPKGYENGAQWQVLARTGKNWEELVALSASSCQFLLAFGKYWQELARTGKNWRHYPPVLASSCQYLQKACQY